jgi:hypothetical protein
MTLAAGLFKQVAYKVETIFGTLPAASAAQALRRVQSSLDLKKDTYQSNEIRTDLQIADFRHGVRRVKGSINGELSCKTYSDFFAAAMKRPFAAVTAIAGASITIAGAGPTYTLTRAAGSYLTDGVKVGDVLRLSAGTFNAANVNKNVMVTALTALVATVMVVNASALVAEGPITGATVTVQGKKTFVPTSGHTDLSFSIEHFYSDLVQSETFSGCKVDKIALSLPPTGMATVAMDFMGQNVTTASAQYFTTPTAVTTTGSLASVNGIVRVNGTTVAILTGLTLNIDPGFTGDPVVGSNQVPALFAGTVNTTGQMTAYFLDTTLRDAFLNETEIDLYAVFTADNTAASDFLAFSLPRIKLGGAAKNDGQGGLVQTIPFQALFNKNGGAGIATEATTISVQDAQA